MKIRSLLLAGAVLPLAMPFSSFAQDPAPTGRIVVAQNQECPEGENCEGKGKGRRAKQQQQEQPAQQQEQPRRQRQQQQEQPAQQQEQPRRQRQQQQEQPAQQQEQPRRQRQQQQEQPAQQQEQPRRQRQQQQEQPAQQQEQPRPRRQQQEQPAQPQEQPRPRREQPAQQQEQPAQQQEQPRPRREQPAQQQEQPAAEQPQRPRDRPQQPAGQDQQPAEPQDGAGQGSDRDQAIERARQRQRELQQQQGQGQPGEPAEGRPRQDGERPRAGAEGPPAADIDTTVDRQLEAQGDRAEADRVRELRDKARRERAAARQGEPPRDGAGAPGQGDQPRDRDGRDVDVDIDIDRDVYRDRDVVERRGGRVIVREGDRNIVRPIVPDEADRLLFRARDVDVDRLPGGRTRTVVHRDNGATVITIRDDYGNLVRRSRRGPDGRDIIIINNYYPEFGPPPRPFIYRPGALPRLVIRIPPERYIVDYGYASPDIIYETLLAPPVMPVDRTFTLDEVLLNEEVRAYLPRIDLDTITFEFGSSTVGPDQMQALSALGDAMGQVLAENPAEVYLIEGHTDAVGSDNDNLILSDERAEAVAVALSQNFDIPAENLVTEGYGEQYLKVPSEGPERQNRRVTVRRITPLLSQSDDPQAGAAP